MGRGGSKKCKPIPAPPRGAGLKSHPIPAPPPLRGGENRYGVKRGGAGQAGRGGAKLPSPLKSRNLQNQSKCICVEKKKKNERKKRPSVVLVHSLVLVQRIRVFISESSDVIGWFRLEEAWAVQPGSQQQWRESEKEWERRRARVERKKYRKR